VGVDKIVSDLVSESEVPVGEASGKLEAKKNWRIIPGNVSLAKITSLDITVV
jgi:hypothetical protein